VRNEDEYLIRDFRLQNQTLPKYHINLAEVTALVHERTWIRRCARGGKRRALSNGPIDMKGESRDSARLDTSGMRADLVY
jgi:hypothetical protein